MWQTPVLNVHVFPFYVCFPVVPFVNIGYVYIQSSLQLRIITSTSWFGVWLTWIIMLYNNFGTDDMSLCVCLSYENESWSYFLALAIWHLVSVCLCVLRKRKLVIFFYWQFGVNGTKPFQYYIMTWYFYRVQGQICCWRWRLQLFESYVLSWPR